MFCSEKTKTKNMRTGVYTNREGKQTLLRGLTPELLFPGFWVGVTTQGRIWRVHEHRLVLEVPTVAPAEGAREEAQQINNTLPAAG
jgi:hypothetical protein